jgi:putative ABC transport system permease protein
VSAVLAGLLGWFCMPLLNDLSGKDLEFNLWNDPLIMAGLTFTVIAVGVVAGSFPALTLVRTGIIRMLSGKVEFKRSRFKLTDVLVVFQFAVSVGLIASTLIIMDQITFIRNRNIGVNTEQLVLVPLHTVENARKYEVLRTELLKYPYIKSVSASTNKVTGGVLGWRGYIVDPVKGPVNIPTVSVEHDFFETMETSIVDGRFFSRDFPADSAKSYIINEAAARLLNLKEPVGSSMFGYAFNGETWSEINAHIIGVVKDFHFSSLHHTVEPVVFSLSSSMTTPLTWLEVRISGENINEATASMKKVWSTIIHEQPFEFMFMEDEIQRYYVAEEQFMKLFISFSGLSLFIGMLGLFGLTAYMAKRRTREIGIRKVVGASTTSLVTLMSRDFLKLVLIASIIGAPVAWYFMDQWLHHFAFQTSITIATFFITALAAMLVAFLAVFYHALYASRSNPVNALRTE